MTGHCICIFWENMFNGLHVSGVINMAAMKELEKVLEDLKAFFGKKKKMQ